MHYRFCTTTKVLPAIVFATIVLVIVQQTVAQNVDTPLTEGNICPCFNSDLIAIRPNKASVSIVVDGPKPVNEWNENWSFASFKYDSPSSKSNISDISVGSYWNHELNCYQCYIGTRAGHGVRSEPPIVHSITEEQHFDCVSEIFKAALEATRSDK